MNYPIGIIPYINMEPYRQLGEPEHCKFVPLVPKQSVAAIKKGQVLAAAIPVGGLPHVINLVEPVGQFGIASRERSMSVLFFSRVPFVFLNKKHRICVTIESTSSVRLLYLLLGYINGFDSIPKLSRKGDFSDGELIIGDEALIKCGIAVGFQGQNSKFDNNWPYVTDLAQLWYETQGFPFVFARWVIRKDVPALVRNSINRWLIAFKEREDELVAKSIKIGTMRLNISEFDMKLYFQVIKRVLNRNDLFGQKLFMDSFQKHRKEPLFEKCT